MFDLIDMLIVRPIVNIFFAIYSLVGDFGIAIILFVIVVKILMWPLMKRQLHQTRIMKEIQPELAEIKKNCKGNRQMESLQMMDLYKRKNVKPFRSFLTILIQLPLFISLFTAINVAARPRENYNVDHSAYSFVKPLRNVDELITKQNKYLEESKKYNESDKKDKLEQPVYEFEPKLFGLVDLSATAGFTSVSSIVILLFALASAATQYIMARQQDPTRGKNGKKKRGFGALLKDAAKGKETSQEEINAAAQGQMTFMMPMMMLLIMISLPGALVFYYLLNNIITVFLQKIILNRNYTEMEAAADKRILKELKDAQEAEIVEDKTVKEPKKASHYASSKNKKDEKLHITRISASNKKKRR